MAAQSRKKHRASIRKSMFFTFLTSSNPVRSDVIGENYLLRRFWTQNEQVDVH